jgi:hypothetical protein
MTLDEQHDFLILDRLLPTKGNLLSDQQLYDLVKDITGNSYDHIKSLLLNKGYLKDGSNFADKDRLYDSAHKPVTFYAIFLTDIGVKAYHDLKKKKRNELIQKAAFWMLFIASILSAFFAGATYFTGCESNNSQSSKLKLPPMQKVPDTYKQLKPPVRHDTTNPKKIASYIYTTKQNTKSNDTTK